MKHLYAGFAVALLTLSTPALAHEGEDHDGAERVIHYDVPAPKTHTAALALLQSKTDEIGEVMKKDKLDGNDLENIHERTYSLEKAVDKLRADATNEAQEAAVDAADEAVQALHYASENHEEAVAREWFAKLKPAVAKAETSFKAAE